MSVRRYLACVLIFVIGLTNTAHADSTGRPASHNAPGSQGDQLSAKNVDPVERIAQALERQVVESQSPQEQDRAEKSVEAAKK